MSRTLTGRRQAEHVAQITGATSTWAWVAEASGRERTRRATVRKIARLTGTEPIRWDGEISDAAWQVVLSAGADALIAHAADEEQALGLDLVAAAEEITAEAAARDTGCVLDRTRTGQARAAELLTRQEPGPAVAASGTEEELVKQSSPFRTSWAPGRTGPRWVCKSGRHGDGSPAQD